MAADAPKGSKLEFETSGKLRGTSIVAAQKGTSVLVEGLFSSLPVRRRELERNIKKEWNKVIGVLNQYACILTGVKFSVSQQPNKGKKIVLFSTKGNRTTRENIVNVFGAKTLTVLIPLELELELEPTTGPGQRRSHQDDGGTKEVQVRGHVSRPVHGEGRQTPDRQMFFVNGRPCGLPQFAKVFNEVYRTYNSSQSPFIFADIRLDTHMYDVNVSPDKRTILLHDQSRLLDNLRESLVALFEAQDYSVPVSQLGALKQTPYKKPTIGRQGTTGSDSTGTSSPSVSKTLRNEVKEPDESQPLEDVGESSANGEQKTLESPLARPSQGISFISRWVERKSDTRKDVDAKPTPPDPESGTGESFVPKKQPVAGFADAEEHAADEDEEEEAAALHSPSREPPQVPLRAADFNARMAELRETSRDAEAEEGSQEQLEVPEPPIPSISPPTWSSEVKTMKSSPRVPRAAPEIATITIGNDTVTSIIGPPAKRIRTEESGEQGPSKVQKASKRAAPLPSFQGRLTQMFAASSTSRTRSARNIDATTELMDGTRRSRSPSDASEVSESLFVRNDEDVDDSEAAHQSPAEEELEEDHAKQDDPGLPLSSLPGSNEDIEDDGPDEDQSPSQPQDSDGDFVDDNADEDEAQEETTVQDMIDAAEETAKTTSEDTQKRQQSFVRGTTKRKDTTTHLRQKLRLGESQLRAAIASLEESLSTSTVNNGMDYSGDGIDADDAEEKLSLTISKSDFGKMKIIGQFNLGFIIAVRPAETKPDDMEDQHALDDELFIIDQHATDEKYNFERLQATTVVQSQRLVQPKALELTAIEEEVIKENIEALEHNGFQVSIDESGYQPVGSRCQLLSLPLSRETTFTLADLEELISLLTDHQSTSENTIPRPSKVRKMFAMRACRSSVMIGKSLPNKQMEKLVRHMGELDKPWNCPHGRPTMRHLCGLSAWNESTWQEGDGLQGEKVMPTNWAAYLRKKREA